MGKDSKQNDYQPKRRGFFTKAEWIIIGLCAIVVVSVSAFAIVVNRKLDGDFVYEGDTSSTISSSQKAAETISISSENVDVVSSNAAVSALSETTASSVSIVTAASSSAEQADNTSVINLNTASYDELITLNGIGDVKAKAIIAYRDTNGGFCTIDDIKNVFGIGDGIFAKIKARICV